MLITVKLNGKKVSEDVEADMLLIDFVRNHGCYSVKRGCETSNCGLCTVFLEDKPVLSCSVLAVRADGKKVTTLEGMQQEAAQFGAFIADQGAEQCGFCNPGFVMNALALFRETRSPGRKRLRSIWQGTCAVVPAMRDSSGGFLHFWNGGKRRSAHEYSKQTCP